MILDDVADCPGLIVECAAALNPEFLSHRHLYALDVVTIPKRFQESIRKTEVHNVVYRPLPEVMVDAKNRGFAKRLEQNTVQSLRRGEICSERLFDNDPGARRRTRLAEFLHHGGKEYRRNRKIVRRSLCGTQFLADCLKGCGVLVIAIDVAEEFGQFVKRGAVQATM